MKKILALIGILILLQSCNRVERIQLLSQLEPALCENIGNPSKVDTVYKDKYTPHSSILYQYGDVPNVSFTQLVTFLSNAYNHKPELTTEGKRQVADFISTVDDNSFKTEVLEYYGEKDNKRYLYVIAVDLNNEIVTPSSQTPQTSVPSR